MRIRWADSPEFFGSVRPDHGKKLGYDEMSSCRAPVDGNLNLPLPANACTLGGLCHKVADCRFQISDFRIPMAGEC